MKVESLVFSACAFFLLITGVVYGIVAEAEPVGTAALLLSGGLCLFIGGYCWFVSRRIDLRPEDREDGEIIEGAGDLGFFAPGSYYPLGLAASAALTGIGIAFFYPWLIGIGGIAVIAAATGLIFEFHTGQNKPSNQH